VHDPSPRQSDARLARELVEQLLRASLTLTDMLASLIEELPEEAFPGEDNAAVLLESARMWSLWPQGWAFDSSATA
jgi:hypothetical protein